MDQIKLHKKCDVKNLMEYGFRKRKNKEIIYAQTIPLYRYKGKIVIEAQFEAFMNHGYIGYDIVDSCSGNLYSAYYNQEWSNANMNNVLRTVKDSLNKELQSMKNAGIIDKYREV